MAKKSGNKAVDIYARHRNDAEWLTTEICNYYRKQADKIKKHSVSDPAFYSSAGS